LTTIAVNETGIAGDKQFTYKGTALVGKTKIYSLSPAGCANFSAKKVLVGFAGSSDSIGEAIHWLDNPDNKPPKLKSIEILMINDRKEIYHATTLSNWFRLDQKIMAIGSGGYVALGAMATGKSPIEAVKLADKYDIYTGMGFNKIML